MRIGYLTGTYPRATDTFIQREIFALRDRNLEVKTFAVRRPNAAQLVGDEQRQECDRTYYLLPPKLPQLIQDHLALFFQSPGRYWAGLKLAQRTSQPGLRGLLYQLVYFVEAGSLARQLQRQTIDHLHNHLGDSSCSVAMLAAHLSDRPYSFTLHGPYIFYDPYRWHVGTKIEQARFVICISHFCRSQAMYFAPFTAWSKLNIVHCGVDPQLFPLVRHHGVGNRLLYVGRLSAAKGLPILLDSLSQLKTDYPDLCLTVVGDGEDRQILEQLTVQRGLEKQVNYVGYKSQAEVRDAMQHTDVFVLPSFAEGVPVSLMEAMAAGVPVVTTRIAGISELVDDGVSGYLVPPGDSEELTLKICRLLDQPELRSQFGSAGRAKVEAEFNIHIEANRLHQVLIESCS
jgi:glycosyltransferase involved in cell wall biosynthesis